MSEELKKYKESWDRASAAMEKLKIAEMQAPDYIEKTLALMEDMFNYAVENGEPNGVEGLLEMQFYIKKLWEKLDKTS